MTNTTTVARPAAPRTAPRPPATAISPAQVAALETALSECGETFRQSNGALARSLAIAQGLQQLQTLIEPAMPSIIGLMNTPLGFLTDRDPANSGKDGKPLSPYEPAIVKRCVIEAALRGARWVGNEFNIISKRPYLTKEFFARKVAEIPGLTDLILQPGVPQSCQNGALVPFVATWRMDGKPMRLERLTAKLDDGSVFDNRIPVRVNAAMGVDAILGKAERKILAAIFKRLTATEIGPTDDADDSAIIETEAITQEMPDDPHADRLAVEQAHEASEGPQDWPTDEPAATTKPPLGEVCLALEAQLHEPGLTAAQIEAIIGDVNQAAADEAITPFEANHLRNVATRAASPRRDLAGAGP
jgi:hypothetical protein